MWALAAFSYWVSNKYLLGLASLVLAFEVLNDFKERRRKEEVYSVKQIAEWVPRQGRSSVSAIGFDKPIQDWEQDAVGRQDFVETVLTRVLVDSEPALGIIADFGEGKSSALHLIQKSIDKGNRAISVPFRTWLPGSEETFLDSLFGTATAAIRNRYFLPSWRSTLRRYGRAVLGVMPKSWELIREVLPPDSQTSQIEELTNLFSRLPVRVVFLLDEIDRMHKEELDVLLKILRGAPELSNVSYICAFSKDALSRLVSPKDPQFGSRYLDKFFPVQLQLPRVDEDLRERLFSERISEVLAHEKVFRSDAAAKRFNDTRSSLWYNALESRLTNFRDIGQVIRGFHSSLHVLKKEVDDFDLLVIECVRLLLPSTYEFVYQNGRYFHDPPTGIERWNRTQFEIDQEARKKTTSARLDEYFQGLTTGDRELACTLLVRIFPSFNAYFREKSKGLGPLLTEGSEGERRISDPNFFSRYFIYAVPATMFGEEEMDNFIASIREADEGTIEERVAITLPKEEPDDLRRIHFLRRLRARVSEIPDKQASALAVAMANRTSTMLRDHVAYQVIKGLVLALAARFEEIPKLQKLLENVVEKAGSDGFAADIVYSSVSGRNNADEITSWTGFDVEHMKKVFGQRMRQRHPTPVSEILPSNLDDPLAFSRWNFYVPEDAPYRTGFFRSAFDFNIVNLGTFLHWLLPGNVGYQNGAIKFIEGFYSSAEIAARLKKAAEGGVQWSPEHMAAIQRFWDFLKEEGPLLPTAPQNP